MKDWTNYQNETYGDNVCKLLIEFLDNYKIDNAIDLGCGSGNETVYMIKNGIKVLAIDRQLNQDFILDTLVLPSSVTRIEAYAFKYQNFKAIKITSNEVPTLGQPWVFHGSTYEILIPEGSYFDYTEQKGWINDYRIRLNDGVNYTAERNGVLYKPFTDTTAFVIGCTDTFKGIAHIKDTIQAFSKTFVVTEIAANAFQSNTSITGIDFGDNCRLKIIGNFAFEQCTNLGGTLAIPVSITALGDA